PRRKKGPKSWKRKKTSMPHLRNVGANPETHEAICELQTCNALTNRWSLPAKCWCRAGVASY
ncbi:hypothetical protein HAX54_049807, partial [Datura stramonium]|nr:hypothetical protein [Datura stramonium]